MTLSEKIQAKEAELTARLEALRVTALKRFSAINGPSSVHQMHAHIGRNNNIFVDSVRMQFQSPSDFIALWIAGLTRTLEEKRASILRRREYGDYKKRTEQIIPEMLQDPILQEYIYIFLERNFYRNFEARVRAKPGDELWQVWFGEGNLVWGLLIAPARRFGEWTNDKSQMRRELYTYWTIGHVLATGLIAPDCEDPVQFEDVNAFLTFYKTVLARVSRSPYEREISALYINYVRTSSDPYRIPLLIPELRFAGKETKHIHRLDFSVLNAHTMEMTGFEFSPASTHMAIDGIKSKTQKTLNEELSKKWAKETAKRNDYFNEYGITTITFADPELTHINKCWERMRKILEAKTEVSLTLEDAENALKAVFATI
ncbi:topoisomerase II [Massilia sp. Mn16-1_5]|uniref:topoisomerase II n=1 Tax=Massilia sp. Mn16-1_5 TaxID=2079199 RepID=UPI00109ED5B1|nr:topoisomerase II [Massilia sp. Mn16-1_5]